MIAIRVERMAERDVRAVAALDAATFVQPREPNAPSAEDRTSEELSRPWTRAWVARDAGDRVVAYLLSWHVADELHVLNVATEPAARRRGIGRALVDAAIAYARANDVRLVVLEVRRSNRAAIALYHGAGFAEIGVRRAYYADGEDAIEMFLELKALPG